jgi:hypothetical protein
VVGDLRSRFRSSRKVSLRHDPNASTVRIHDGNAAHLSLAHHALDAVNVVILAAALR